MSGEITLHADHVYVQVCQSRMGHQNGILIRTCEGRKDYVGGPDNFASLDLLNRPEELARRIKAVCRLDQDAATTSGKPASASNEGAAS